MKSVSLESNLDHVARVVAAYVSNNPTSQNDLPALIKNTAACFDQLTNPNTAATDKAPAVPVKKSITPDYLICLEDGKRLKMLKRYLRSRYSLTPEQYRQKWGLPGDYPMVASNYAAVRSAFAKKIGLGRTASTPAKKKGK